MSQVKNLTHKEIADQGEALYHQQILTKVDTPENLGKIIAIDISGSAIDTQKPSPGPNALAMTPFMPLAEHSYGSKAIGPHQNRRRSQ